MKEIVALSMTRKTQGRKGEQKESKVNREKARRTRGIWGEQGEDKENHF